MGNERGGREGNEKRNRGRDFGLDKVVCLGINKIKIV